VEGGFAGIFPKLFGHGIKRMINKKMPLVTIWNSSDLIFEMLSSALKALSTIRRFVR
jgi:hypothetical protein